MQSVESSGTATTLQAFTVLIPRPLQSTVEGLPAEVRQALLAELFRMAALGPGQRPVVPLMGPCSLQVEVAGCEARVELDTSRCRLTLVGVQRPLRTPSA